MKMRLPQLIWNHLKKTATIFAMAIGFFIVATLPGQAQSEGQWLYQQVIPNYIYNTQPPYLVADQNGTVHAFSTQHVEDGERIIFYNQWTLEEGWTAPVDILLSPMRGQAWIEGVFLDQEGYFHIIFFGGDDVGANIYYSRALALDADKAPAWSSPELIGAQAVPPRIASLAGDDQGNLVVLYGGNRDGNGLYVIYSMDNGDNWTEPEPIFLTYSSEQWPYYLQMTLTESGLLHVVWNVVNVSGQNLTGYYSRLDVAQKQWSEPMDLGPSVALGIALTTIIEYRNELFLVYNNGVVGEGAPVHWMRRSMNGGHNWTDPVRIFPRHIGRNGVISLVVDSNDTLHILFGQRMPGSPDIHGMWHSVWRDERWTEPVAIASGPRTSAFDPFDARAVVSQGNVLLATWRTDPGREMPGVWYSHTTLDAPELERVPLPTSSIPTPTLTPTPTVTPLAAAREEITPTPVPVLEFDRLETEPPSSNPNIGLLVSIAPSVLVIIFVVMVSSLHRRKQD